MSTQAARDYRQRGWWPRWRLRLTMIGVLTLPFISWHWGNTHSASWSYPPGALVTLTGILLRLWAAGWLRKNQDLAAGGPYAYTRNPLYLGTGLIACGHGLMSTVPLMPLIFPALWLVVYYPAMRDEEAYLAQQYGDEFETYRAGVPLLLPRIRPYSSNLTSRFSWHQVRRNREYEAAIINVVLIVFYGWLTQTR